MKKSIAQKTTKACKNTQESPKKLENSELATPFYNMGVTKFFKIQFPLLRFSKIFKKNCIALLNLYFYIEFIILLYKIYRFVIYE